jgi:hypothetical protein
VPSRESIEADPIINETRDASDKFTSFDKSFSYSYDFGDGWEHMPRLRKPCPSIPPSRIPNSPSTKITGMARRQLRSIRFQSRCHQRSTASHQTLDVKTLFSGRLPRFFVVWGRAAGSMFSLVISENRHIKTHRLFGFAMNHKSGVGFAYNFYCLY